MDFFPPSDTWWKNGRNKKTKKTLSFIFWEEKFVISKCIKIFAHDYNSLYFYQVLCQALLHPQILHLTSCTQGKIVLNNFLKNTSYVLHTSIPKTHIGTISLKWKSPLVKQNSILRCFEECVTSYPTKQKINQIQRDRPHLPLFASQKHCVLQPWLTHSQMTIGNYQGECSDVWHHNMCCCQLLTDILQGFRYRGFNMKVEVCESIQLREEKD